jgi:hypothetical protein
MIAMQAASPAPTSPPEALDAPMPAGFKVGFADARDGQTMEERIPAVETVDVWTRMITVQRFAGLARVGPRALLERLGALMIGACPGAAAEPVANGNDSGRPTASLRVNCPLNPATGKPETMFARAFQGSSDIHLVQYAYRAIPSAGEAEVATGYLNAVRLEGGSTGGR